MSRRLIHLYHRLPAWARSAAATAQGIRLNWWRWSAESEALVAEALERESWSPERWRGRQLELLAERLDHAARSVPYYREQWAERRRRGDRSSWERLENWPLLEKETIRRHGEAFVAEDAAVGPLRLEATSGTTGVPLYMRRSRRTLVQRYAIYEARHRLWYGVSRRDRWAMAAGQLVVPASSEEPPYWVWNAAMRQLYVSSYHLKPEQARRSAAAIAKYRCRYAWGYPSTFALLAQSLGEVAEAPRLSCIVSKAEPLLATQKELIESAFGCRAYESYGMVELVAAAGECRAGAKHWFPEFGHVEILDAEQHPVPNGVAGEIVGTSLLDADMPLIRYRTGDSAANDDAPQPCACGRGLPRVKSIEGRRDDVIYSAAGRPVGRLSPVFKGDYPIREAQIVQEELGAIRVLIAPAGPWRPSHENGIARALRDRLGDIDVRFDTVTAIPRGANGKFRSVVSRLPYRPDQALAARAGSFSR